MRAFLGKEEPRLTFDDGVEVVRLLMTAYPSAEQGSTLEFPPKGIDKFVPQWRREFGGPDRGSTRRFHEGFALAPARMDDAARICGGNARRE